MAERLDDWLMELLHAMPYSSSMTVALGFAKGDFPRPLEGFGFLVPRRERQRLVAATWVGTKLPHRMPEGTVVIRCFLGGASDAEALAESDDGVVASVVEELHRIVGFRARLRFVRIFRWPRSMAQYAVGHQQRLAEIRQRVSALEGLALAGNAYSGIGISDCIRTGREAAARVGGG